MGEAKKEKKDLSLVCTIVGLAIMALFWVLPPAEPITPVGMKCLGTFIGMVWLWSTVDTLWPSILGLFLIGISGYDAGGMNSVWMNAVGNSNVLLTMFAMTLFGAVYEVGATMYIARWFLTKEVFKGRPFVFIATLYVCMGVMSALLGTIATLIIMWPIALSLCNTLGIKREDRIWSWIFVGMFMVVTLMQPFLPFKGAQLIPLSAFESMSASMGNPMSVPYAQYMATNLIMTTTVMAIYLFGIKLLRVDISKLKAIDPEMIKSQMVLPPATKVQKAYLAMIPAYICVLLIPGFIKGNPICAFLNSLGPLGLTVAFVVFFLVVKVDGKPLLNFKEMAYKQMQWGIFFMIAAAVYGANTLSNKSTGVTEFLVQTLNPILGGQSEMGFVALMLLVALVITNFANNAAMAVVLMPVVLAFSEQLGINPMPVAMGVTLMVFVAMLTPSASPHAGLMHGRKDLYSTAEILKIGFPMCIITWALYSFIGYPMMKIMLGI